MLMVLHLFIYIIKKIILYINYKLKIMRYDKTSITFLGDSIMKYKNNSPKSNSFDIVIKKLIKKFNKNLIIY